MVTSDFWYENALVYGLDVETFMDSNRDGVGDFQGLVSRLDGDAVVVDLGPYGYHWLRIGHVQETAERPRENRVA